MLRSRLYLWEPSLEAPWKRQRRRQRRGADDKAAVDAPAGCLPHAFSTLELEPQATGVAMEAETVAAAEAGFFRLVPLGRDLDLARRMAAKLWRHPQAASLG